MIAVIDNFDSFTYNLVQYLEMAGQKVQVFRNNAITVDRLCEIDPSGVVISPGPGRPESAGVTLEAILGLSGKVPLLGVCLGHQSIARAFGAEVVPAKEVMHGKVSFITTDEKGIFKGIASPMKAMRYHSLAVKKESLPSTLEITAQSADGEIMGLQHKTHPTFGVQFHPESIMTTTGKRLIKNFLRMAKGAA